MVTGQPIFTFYKKGYLFELSQGISLNKNVKRQIESERTNDLIQKARENIEMSIKN